MNLSTTANRPLRSFTMLSSIAVVVGIVVGIGIFRLPPIVAQYSANEFQFIFFWIAGGGISLLGALCYAELASSQPDAGGEYYFLRSAYGPSIGFLFSWGRMTVIQTGSIALIAFILGDYATLIYDLGSFSPAIYAACSIILLTGLNIWGTLHSRRFQMFFTTAIVLVLILISVSGFFAVSEGLFSNFTTSDSDNNLFSEGSIGLAMIFVLLTYGGWNEVVYISGELQDAHRKITKVLIIGICVITAIYVLVNTAYLYVLGLDVLRESPTAGSELTERIFGARGSFMVSLLVIAAALSTANATIITGARTNYALGRDFKLLGKMGNWNQVNNSPDFALFIQGAIALVLVILGAWSEEAVSTLVDFTAPVFWFFLFLTTFTLFIFRKRFGHESLTFRVPFYPVIPLLFLITCTYMLYSSIVFTGLGAMIGVGILILGYPVYLAAKKYDKRLL